MITLYYGSGSPYAWRVQLALEHKALPYERKVLSFAAGDTRKPEFVALNPRHRVPTIVDGEFVLYESNAIVEYLDEAYAGRGSALFPGNPERRALIRRLISEVDNYFDKAIDPVIDELLYKKPEEKDAKRLADAVQGVREDYALFERALAGDFLAGPLSAADFAFYPLVAFLDRCAVRVPGFDAASLLPRGLAAWKQRMEALPFMAATIPPHWQKKD
ncbi:MAG: glutathione S-transferase family protein [Burkholderiales bacterium]